MKQTKKNGTTDPDCDIKTETDRLKKVVRVLFSLFVLGTMACIRIFFLRALEANAIRFSPDEDLFLGRL